MFGEASIDEILKDLTDVEKISLCIGASNWETAAIRKKGIPSVMMCDGPHGVRHGEKRGRDKISICFPTACASACTFNPELMTTMGTALGVQCRNSTLSLLLGPGVNIKRSPLCGRNFEYFSEDPYLAGRMGIAYVKGVQSQGIGACVKHFCANNQEERRHSSNSIIDEQTLREIYLTPFEMIVKEAHPWAVMCAYNLVNGVPASEHEENNENILRKEWGFDGFVVSDWLAVASRPVSMKGGIDLEMPGNQESFEYTLEMLRNGSLSMDVVDKCAKRVLQFIEKAHKGRSGPVPQYVKSDHHEIARAVAEEAVVLLKNDDGILPLRKDAKVLYVTASREIEIQGEGSSYVFTASVDSLDKYPGMEFMFWQRGSDMQPIIDAAQTNDIVIVTVGTRFRDTEGEDRVDGMELDEQANQLIQLISRVQKNIIVVVHNGAPVIMPWVDDVKGIIETYYGGEAIERVLADILSGKINPSGRLAETFPKRVEDTPSFLSFGNQHDVFYHEGIFVGYRYYDKKKIDVQFPFGYGLSYTTFEYSNLVLSKTEARDDEEIIVSVDVKNTGSCTGKEVVQLYVSDRTGYSIRPVKELKGFSKVSLDPGETKTVEIRLDRRSFAHWNTRMHDWYAPTGPYEILICKNANEVIMSASIKITSSVPDRTPVTHFTPECELAANPVTREVFGRVIFKCEIAEGVRFWDSPVHMRTLRASSVQELDLLVEECNKALNQK